MINISKELVGAVLHESIIYIQIHENEILYEGDITDTVFLDWSDSMNIYEFASNCKEWAFEKGWILESCRASNYTDSNGQFESKRFMTSCTSLTSKRGKTFESITSEVESIIIACEWILDKHS